MRGRKPLPPELKILKGGKAFKAEEQERVALEPPAEMTGDSRAAFNRIKKLLEKLRVLKDSDAEVLELYAFTYGQWAEVRKRLAKEGPIVVSAAGTAKTNPLISLDSNLRGQLLKILVELGLTPSSRARIGVQASTPKESSLSSLLKSRPV